jgi:hypothetical protein
MGSVTSQLEVTCASDVCNALRIQHVLGVCSAATATQCAVSYLFNGTTACRAQLCRAFRLDTGVLVYGFATCSCT